MVATAGLGMKANEGDEFPGRWSPILGCRVPHRGPRLVYSHDEPSRAGFDLDEEMVRRIQTLEEENKQLQLKLSGLIDHLEGESVAAGAVGRTNGHIPVKSNGYGGAVAGGRHTAVGSSPVLSSRMGRKTNGMCEKLSLATPVASEGGLSATGAASSPTGAFPKPAISGAPAQAPMGLVPRPPVVVTQSQPAVLLPSSPRVSCSPPPPAHRTAVLAPRTAATTIVQHSAIPVPSPSPAASPRLVFSPGRLPVWGAVAVGSDPRRNSFPGQKAGTSVVVTSPVVKTDLQPRPSLSRITGGSVQLGPAKSSTQPPSVGSPPTRPPPLVLGPPVVRLAQPANVFSWAGVTAAPLQLSAASQTVAAQPAAAPPVAPTQPDAAPQPAETSPSANGALGASEASSPGSASTEEASDTLSPATAPSQPSGTAADPLPTAAAPPAGETMPSVGAAPFVARPPSASPGLASSIGPGVGVSSAPAETFAPGLAVSFGKTAEGTSDNLGACAVRPPPASLGSPATPVMGLAPGASSSGAPAVGAYAPAIAPVPWTSASGIYTVGASSSAAATFATRPSASGVPVAVGPVAACASPPAYWAPTSGILAVGAPASVDALAAGHAAPAGVYEAGIRTSRVEAVANGTQAASVLATGDAAIAGPVEAGIQTSRVEGFSNGSPAFGPFATGGFATGGFAAAAAVDAGIQTSKVDGIATGTAGVAGSAASTGAVEAGIQTSRVEAASGGAVTSGTWQAATSVDWPASFRSNLMRSPPRGGSLNFIPGALAPVTARHSNGSAANAEPVSRISAQEADHTTCSCGATFPDDANFCTRCGKQRPAGLKAICSCGVALPEDANFCIACGEPRPPGSKVESLRGIAS